MYNTYNFLLLDDVLSARISRELAIAWEIYKLTITILYIHTYIVSPCYLNNIL